VDLPRLALPFIGIAQGTVWGHAVGNASVAGLPMRLVTDPQALLVCIARKDTDDGRPLMNK
jgi:hypothetical protein